MDKCSKGYHDTRGIVGNTRMCFVRGLPSMSSGSRPAERSGGSWPRPRGLALPCLSADLARRARAGLTALLKEAGYKEAHVPRETVRRALDLGVYLGPKTRAFGAARASKWVQRIRSVYADFMGEHDQSYYPEFSTPCAMLSHSDCEGFLRRRGKWDVPCACYCHDESSVLSRIA